MNNDTEKNGLHSNPPLKDLNESMEQVIHYLELKNLYYNKFYSLTAKFKNQPTEKRWNKIELLVDNRERIISIIKHFDLKIGKELEGLQLSTEELEHYRARVTELHNRRVTLANKIMTKDLELISLIDDMKSETIRELKQTQDVQSQLQSFQGANPEKTNKHDTEA